mgnify:CR=1 FL=1
MEIHVLTLSNSLIEKRVSTLSNLKVAEIRIKYFYSIFILFAIKAETMLSLNCWFLNRMDTHRAVSSWGGGVESPREYGQKRRFRPAIFQTLLYTFMSGEVQPNSPPQEVKSWRPPLSHWPQLSMACLPVTQSQLVTIHIELKK